MAFFSAPTEPVRINAKTFLGLQTPKEVTPEREEAKPIAEEAAEEEKQEKEETDGKKEESESGSSDYDNVEKDEETITEGSDSEAENNSGYVRSIQKIPTIEIVEVEGSTQDSEVSEEHAELEAVDELAAEDVVDEEMVDTEEKTEDDSQVTETESVKRASEIEALQRIDALLQQPDEKQASGGDTEEDVEDLDLQDELDKIDHKMEMMRQTVHSMMEDEMNVAMMEDDDEAHDGCYIPESTTLTENMAGILADDQPQPSPQAEAVKLNKDMLGFDQPLDIFSSQPNEAAVIVSPSKPLIDFGDSPPETTVEDSVTCDKPGEAEKQPIDESSSAPLADLEDQLQELTDAALIDQPLIDLQNAPQLTTDSLTEDLPVALHDGIEQLSSEALVDSTAKPQVPETDFTNVRVSDVTADLLGDETLGNIDDIVTENEAVSVSVLDETISQEVQAQKSAFTRVPQASREPTNLEKPRSVKASPAIESPVAAQSPLSFRSPPSYKSPISPKSSSSFQSPVSYKSPLEIQSPPILPTSVVVSPYTASVLTAGTKEAISPSGKDKPKLKLKIDGKSRETEDKSLTPEVEEELIVNTPNIKSDIKAKALLLLQKPGPLHNPVFDTQPAAADKRPSRSAVRKVHALPPDDEPKESSYKRRYERLPPIGVSSMAITSPPTFTTSPPTLIQAPVKQTITPATQAKSRMLFSEKPKPTKPTTKIVPSAGSAFSPVRAGSHTASPGRTHVPTSRQEDALRRIDNLLDSVSERKGSHVEDMELGPEQDFTDARDTDHIQGPRIVTVTAERIGDQELFVDETFITTRERGRNKHKKRIPSGHSETNVTPSSGSSARSVSSSNADMDSTGHSLGDTLNEIDSIDVLVSSDRETSVSLEGLLDTNAFEDNTVARKAKSDTTLSVGAPDKSLVGNDSVEDSSNSQYFTPNTSTIEPMELTLDFTRNSSRNSQHSEPKSYQSDRSSPLYSPRKNMFDAKRQFFFDATEPVRIDPKTLFPELKTPDGKVKKIVESPKKGYSREKENVVPVENGVDGKKGDADKMREWKSFEGGVDSPLKSKLGDVEVRRDWQSFDNELLTSPTSPCEDVFSTPSTSVKQKPVDDVFKRPGDPAPRKKLLAELPDDDASKVLSPEEIKIVKDVEREKARQQARDRARLLSDEELGIPPVRKGSLKNTPSGDELETERSVSESHSAISEPDKSESSKLDSQVSEPLLRPDRSSKADSYHRQVSSEPECAFGSTESGGASDRSQEKGAKKVDSKPKRFKLKAPERQKSHEEGKSKDLLRKDKKEGDKGEKKEKRRSLLGFFMSSKSVEKKEKEGTTSPKPKDKDDKTGSAEKKLGVKLRSKLKPQKSAEKEEEREKRASSVYDEFVPFFEDISGEDLDQNRSSFRERLEQVAPNQPKTTPKIAPKAQGNSFSTWHYVTSQ